MATFNPQKAQRLALHLKSLIQPRHPLILTNIHDAPTTSLALSHPKTQALATASFAIAAQAGLPDEELDLSTSLAAIARIRAVMVREGKADSVPLTADMQDGYGEDLREAVEKVVKLGVVGCNPEDSRTSGNGEGAGTMELISADAHVARIKPLSRLLPAWV